MTPLFYFYPSRGDKFYKHALSQTALHDQHRHNHNHKHKTKTKQKHARTASDMLMLPVHLDDVKCFRRKRCEMLPATVLRNANNSVDASHFSVMRNASGESAVKCFPPFGAVKCFPSSIRSDAEKCLPSANGRAPIGEWSRCRHSFVLTMLPVIASR